ncbi:MAG TPA: hypothetical protein VFJ65_06105 [Solirubrobacterales bacterium]|nr:hypothetical protein [Solirubrobacterales bacterium]
MISSPEAPQTLEIPYRWAGVEGMVRVVVRTNDEPEALGCPEMARGFPFCKALVESGEAEGYDHYYGWVQMVDLSDEPAGFRIDQHPKFAAPHPFISAGPLPGFADAPFTDYRDWDFLAHAFLCGTGGELLKFRKEARAILGFSWGFSKRGQQVEWFGPDLLSAEDWNSHLERMAEERPDWSFKPGFFQHPLDP